MSIGLICIHLRGHCPFSKVDEHGSPVKLDNHKLDLVRLFDTEVWKNLIILTPMKIPENSVQLRI
jgi:hypothetical protein